MLVSTNITNHCVRRTSRETSRVAFEIGNPIDNQATLEVWRIRHNGKKFISSPNGLILKSEIRRRIIVIAIVSIGDLVVIRTKNSLESAPQFRCYRIGAEYVPSLEDPVHSSREIIVIASAIDLIVIGKEPPIRFPSHEMRKFFAARNPKWIQEVIDEQLASWKERVPETFIRYAPKDLLGHELPLLVICAPEIAIAFYKERLTTIQLESCILAHPDAALHHCFDKMPQRLKFQSLGRYPSYGLQRLLFHLSDAELRLCARLAPSTAFPLRASLSGNKHAIILSASFTQAGLDSKIGHSSSSLRREIVVSILRYPEEWLLTYDQSLPWLFTNLSTWLDLHLNPLELQRLARKLPPAQQNFLYQHIVDRI